MYMKMALSIIITSISKYYTSKTTRTESIETALFVEKRADSALFNHATRPFLRGAVLSKLFFFTANDATSRLLMASYYYSHCNQILVGSKITHNIYMYALQCVA